jgi:hypothetical protein
MSRYEPELGQAIFSNTPWGEIEMQEMVEWGIALLGEIVTPLTEPQPNGEYLDPCANTGTEFENDVFSIRAYCWCDGERHPEGCPPNFEYREGPSKSVIFSACWYKYLGRGGSQSRELTPPQWAYIVRRCLESVGG